MLQGHSSIQQHRKPIHIPHPRESEKTKGMLDTRNGRARSEIMATRRNTGPNTRKRTHGLLKTIDTINRHSQHGLKDNKRKRSKINPYIQRHTQITHKVYLNNTFKAGKLFVFRLNKDELEEMVTVKKPHITNDVDWKSDAETRA